MSVRSFILVGFSTLLLLTLSLHSSLVGYIEQQYHNFSESKSATSKALAFIWDKSFLQDNALFELTDHFLESLEGIRSGAIAFLAQSATPKPKKTQSKKSQMTKNEKKQVAKSSHKSSTQASSQTFAKEPLAHQPLTEPMQSSQSTQAQKNEIEEDKIKEGKIEEGEASQSQALDTQTPNPQAISQTTSQKEDISESSSPKAATQSQTSSKNSTKSKKKAVKNPRIRLESGDSVLLIGDSMMQGSAPYMLKSFKKLNLNGINLSKHSTGLTYKHYFDWANATQEAFEKDPNIALVVVLLGANDPWSMKKEGNKINFKSKAWEEIYRERIDEIIEIAHSYGARVAWYEVPYVRDEALNKKIIYLNSLYEAQVRQSGEFYFKSNGILTQDGRYDAFIKDHKGDSVQVRVDDGVHFTSRGYWLLASILLNALEVSKDEELGQ